MRGSKVHEGEQGGVEGAQGGVEGEQGWRRVAQRGGGMRAHDVIIYA